MKSNSFFTKIKRYIRNPRRIFERNALKKLIKEGSHLTDEDYLVKMFKIKLGKKLNLSNPKTFNEKMQYLKLNDRKTIYTTMVDKHAVKEYVSSIIGREHVAKEFGVWNSFEEIDFSSLPNEFVLKTTHGCGGLFVCKNKNSVNFEDYKNTFSKSLSENYYLLCREWPYKNVAPKIIAEELLKDGDKETLPVFKFFCFNGEPFIAQVIQNDKHINETIDYVDMNWNYLKIKQNYPNSKHKLPKPNCFDEMKRMCSKLSNGIPFVRCDLYAVNGKVFFSEFTFYSDAGFEKFHPKKWDLILGRKINI